MASATAVVPMSSAQSQLIIFSTNTQLVKTTPRIHAKDSSTHHHVSLIRNTIDFQHNKFMVLRRNCSVTNIRYRAKTAFVSATAADHQYQTKAVELKKKKQHQQGQPNTFADELRFVAIKLHTNDSVSKAGKDGQNKEIVPPRLGQLLMTEQPSSEGYLRFLVDSKVVYDMLEKIVQDAACASHAEFRNTGLERSANLAKDLEWFKKRGHEIPEPSAPGLSYALYLENLSVKDPKAFPCHFYNVYFGHAAGGRMFGRKVAEKILDNKELEFYKWDGELSQILNNAKDILNRVAEGWTREEKDHCLQETEISFKYSEDIMRHILS